MNNERYLHDICLCNYIFRPGVTYHETLKIEDIQVGGDPDARLKAFSSSETIAVIEVLKIIYIFR